MGVSQILFDAIQRIEAELIAPGEYSEQLRQEIAALVKRMKDVQRKLDAELTEIDTSDDE
jgi:hypothetical protein